METILYLTVVKNDMFSVNLFGGELILLTVEIWNYFSNGLKGTLMQSMKWFKMKLLYYQF